MSKQIELRNIMFENVDAILDLAPGPSQIKYVGPVSKTIAIAYAGINEGFPGFLQAIYYNLTLSPKKWKQPLNC